MIIMWHFHLTAYTIHVSNHTKVILEDSDEFEFKERGVVFLPVSLIFHSIHSYVCLNNASFFLNPAITLYFDTYASLQTQAIIIIFNENFSSHH